MAAGDPGSPARYYSSTAVETSLQSSIPAQSQGQSNTSFIVASISGFPTSYPYTLIVDPDTSKEEVVTVTSGSSTTLTVTRGADNTQAVAHSAGAVVRHGVSGREFRESENHIAARGYDIDEAILVAANQTHVHGIATGEGVVVGTLKTQTLTNKTLTSPVITNPSISGAGVDASIVFEGTTADAYETTLTVVDPTQDNTITLPNTTGTVVITTAVQTLTNKTMGDALNAGGFKITNLATPTDASDAVRKDFADAQVAAAATSAASAATSASSALTSANSASASATAAAASVATIASYATAAASSATAAATSATSAANSATAAATSATSAAASATAAATSATSAAASATAAATSATSASNSATAAATSATSAAASATTAAASVASIATYASDAANSATAAATSATSAAASATAAATSASSAATSASSALTSANSAAASYDQFDDRYLGSKTSDPTVDNDGNPLITGALYFNSVTNAMKVYTGSAWVNVAPDTSNFIDKSVLSSKGALLGASGASTPFAVTPASTNGYILSIDSATTSGLAWIAPSTADITSVTAGTGLSGGGTSGDVTVSLDTTSIYVVPSQTGQSGKYLTTDGSTASWGTVSSYTAPTLGSTLISSGTTVSTITALTLNNTTISGTTTASGTITTTGDIVMNGAFGPGSLTDEFALILMGGY